MCFVIEEGNENPLIAEEDIPCWKRVYPYWDGSGVVPDKWTAHFQCFVYEKGKEYQQPEPLKVSLHRGIWRPINPISYIYAIDDGFHSYISWEEAQARSTGSYCIACTIPKGATYYKNVAEGHYVSTHIKIIDVCVST